MPPLRAFGSLFASTALLVCENFGSGRSPLEASERTLNLKRAEHRPGVVHVCLRQWKLKWDAETSLENGT